MKLSFCKLNLVGHFVECETKMNNGIGVNITQVFGALPLPHLLTSQHFYRIFFCLKAHDANEWWYSGAKTCCVDQ